MVSKWGASNYSYLLMLYGKKVRVRLSDNGTSYSTLTSATTLTADQWAHVAVVRCDDEVSLWINGTKDSNTLTFSNDVYSGSAPVRLGATAKSGSYWYYHGEIDEVRQRIFAALDSKN